MATITLKDGSSLELDGEELLLYLQVTGQATVPKTEAERVAELMIELRRDDIQRTVRQTVGDCAPVPTTDAEAKAHEAAIAEGTLLPHPATMPAHVAATIRPCGPVELPMTADEYKVYEVLKKTPVGITSKDIAASLGWSTGKASTHCSAMFQDERGVYLGSKRRWFLRGWARRVTPMVTRYPNKNWPPKEGVPS